jgi:glycosyltransferase involved in cell wall biosynthesis
MTATSTTENGPARKVIFACNFIKPDNVNTPEYQRVKLLSRNFRVALVYRWAIPDASRRRCQETYRVGGGIFSVVRGFFLIAYLRFAKGYTVVYTSPETFGIIWGYLAKVLFGCVWIYDLWDHPSLELVQGRPLIVPIKKVIFDTLLRKLLQADGWIIGMHEGVLEHLPGSYPRDKIVKVTNGVDLTVIDSALEKGSRGRARQNETLLKVCYAGPIVLQRGMSVLLESLASLDKEFRVRVDLFGERHEDTLTAIKAHNMRSPHEVRYHGYLAHEKALAKLAESDVCLCVLDPSVLNFQYSYPIKLFEYLALSRVVVASRTLGMAEIIEDGDNGFLTLYSAEDLKAVFDKIIAMRNDGEIQRIRRSARETATNYSWQDINEKILLHLRKLLELRA